MNERIKKLAEQAKKSATKNGAYNLAFVMADFEQKFAELIVKECAETIRGSMIKHCTGVVLNTDYNLGLSKASTSIKEHFGVEE